MSSDSIPSPCAAIRIKAGNPGDNDPGVGGDVARVYAWDVNNNCLGEGDDGLIGIGGVLDTTIDSLSAGSRANFTSVAITVTQFDGPLSGAWTGDIGYECGQNGFMNTEKAGYLNKDDPLRETTFQCVPAGKQEYKPRKPWMENTLVVSKIEQPKAVLLCNSETSWGPDFVGSDSLYCDMGTHTLAPLCSTSDVDGCFSLNSTVLTKRLIRPKRAVELPHKEYFKVKHWDVPT
ncbi:hypothetical protein DL98DRAFT_554645 [Cadophora sp. DSE1049]|nr:hypothetical protein DL98DRAFT_554645 [Cadophora sp. DSE1049]